MSVYGTKALQKWIVFKIQQPLRCGTVAEDDRDTEAMLVSTRNNRWRGYVLAIAITFILAYNCMIYYSTVRNYLGTRARGEQHQEAAGEAGPG